MLEGIFFEGDRNLFCKEIDETRKDLFMHGQFDNCTEAETWKLADMDFVPEGRFNVWAEKVLLECFFHYKKGMPLWVFLNGACMGKERPQFKRWTYSYFLQGSMLNIADPMYQDFENLKLGWYFGNEKQNYRDNVVMLVKKIARMLGVKEEEIIYFASSGGGAAAIECAAKTGNARTLVINPQICLKDYFYADEFTRITGINLDQADFHSRSNVMEYLCNNSNCILVANAESEVDMLQVSRVMENLDVRVEYGLNVYENLVIWIYEAECAPYVIPHNCQENSYIWPFLEQLVFMLSDRKRLRDMRGLYTMLGEVWRGEWKAKKEQYILSRLNEKQDFMREGEQDHT